MLSVRISKKKTCRRLLKPPYVCNGCGKRSVCSLEKRLYIADFAHREYRDILSESRTGLSYSEDEIRYLDEFISPLIRQNQSPHHICATNADYLTVSERTIYRLIDARIISAMNIDLPRKVRYNARKVECHLKVDKACLIGRTYEDFKGYLLEYPDLAITQLDPVEGKKGNKVLLTIHFVKAELMLAFLRDHNDSQSVIDIFERLYFELRPDVSAHCLKSVLQITAPNFQIRKQSNTTGREICAPVFFIVIRALLIKRALRNVTMNLYAVFFRKELTLLPIRRRISVS